MSQSVHLMCRTIDGDESFVVNFVMSGSRWTQGEPGSTSKVFKTKSGTFVVVANTASLKSGNTVVAELRNFNPGPAREGNSGNDGKALETAKIFTWRVETVVP